MIREINNICRRILIVSGALALAILAMQYIVDASIAEDQAYERTMK